ncbi:MAG: peroxiredoxin-like family protein [Panacagrimonas sp.]
MTRSLYREHRKARRSPTAAGIASALLRNNLCFLYADYFFQRFDATKRLMIVAKGLTIDDVAPEFNLQDADGHSFSLSDLVGKPVALLFMRYVGCPVCQMDTIEYKQQYQALKDAGLEVVMVFQSSLDNLQRYSVKEVLPFTTLSDPKGEVYKAYGAGWGIGGFLSVKNLSPMVRSLKSGHRHGKFEGNEFQYPAAFIIDMDGRVRFSHYGKTVTDGISPQALLNEFKALDLLAA